MGQNGTKNGSKETDQRNLVKENGLRTYINIYMQPYKHISSLVYIHTYIHLTYIYIYT